MDNFTRQFLTEWRKLDLPFNDGIFVAAVSGGADSVSLLLVLDELRRRKKLNNRFIIAHFNHNLRGADADADAEFVRNLCVRHDFEFACGSGNIAEKGNLEQNARLARYGFLENTAANLRAGGILTAHTMNDQAETFLLNLLRGSGLQGLGGMAADSGLKVQGSRFNIQGSEFETEPDLIFNEQSRDERLQIANRKSQIRLVRPFLSWAQRIDTENYCNRHETEFRRDAMNDDLNFKRVRVRKILLPLLGEFNPKVITVLANTAALLRLETESGNAEIDFDWKAAEMSIQKLKNLSQSEFYLFLRKWLEHQRGDLRGLSLKHFQAVERLVYSRKSGKIAELPNGAAIVRGNGKILFKEIKVEK